MHQLWRSFKIDIHKHCAAYKNNWVGSFISKCLKLQSLGLVDQVRHHFLRDLNENGDIIFCEFNTISLENCFNCVDVLVVDEMAFDEQIDSLVICHVYCN